MPEEPEREESQEEPEPEQSTELQPRKWAGKYDSPEALEQGYRHSSAEASNLQERIRMLEAENRTQAMLLEHQRAQAAAATENAEMKRLAEAGAEAGLDIEAILRKAAQAGAAAADARVKPVEATAEALSMIPTEDQAAASRLLEEDPQLKQTYRDAVLQNPKLAGRMLAAEVKLRKLADPEAGMHQETPKRKGDAGIVRSKSADRPGPDRPTTDIAERRRAMIEARLGTGKQGFDKKFATDLLAGSIEIWEDLQKPRRVI